MDNISIELLRKNMDTVILRSLYDGRKYGLEIYNDIKNSSQELYTLKQATMYKTLKKMEEDALIMSAPGEESNGAKRVYLSLTDLGRQKIEQTMKEWEFSRTILDKLVSDKVFNPSEETAPFDVAKLRPKTKRSTRRTDTDEYDDASSAVDSDMQSDELGNAINITRPPDSDQASCNGNCDDVAADISAANLNSLLPDAAQVENGASIITNQSANDNGEYRSIFHQIEKEQSKIHIDNKFKFTSEIDKKLIDNAKADAPIANNQMKNVELPVKGDQDSALYTLYSNNYESPKSSEYHPTSTFKSENKELADKPTPFQSTVNNDYFAYKTNNRSQEEVSAAAQKLYDREYNMQSSPSITYQSPIVGSNARDKQDILTHYNTEVRAKDTLSLNEKRKIFDDFMTADSTVDNTRDSKENASYAPAFETMQHDIMTTTVENNRAKQNVAREKAATVFNHNAFDIHSVETVVVKPPKENPKADKGGESVNYISSFDNIFKASAAEPQTTTQTNNMASIQDYNDPIEYEDMSFGKLKVKLAADDIKLKQYLKSNTATYYVGRFYYSNRILRDWSLVVYAMFFVFAIAMHFITNAVAGKASVAGLMSVILIGACMPICTTMLWVYDKNKRKRTNYNVLQSIISCTIVMMIALLVIFLVAYLGFKINFSDIKTFFEPLIVPIISLLLLPLSVLSYTILYNSKIYHVK